jgi:hypothetical protein
VSKLNPCVVPVMGATGSGKSQALMRMLAKQKPARSLIWNPMQKKTRYAGEECTHLVDLVDGLGAKGKFNRVFVPTWDFDLMREQFEIFCGFCLELENLTVLVEELKYVTRPGWAPPNWRRVTGDGRQYGLRVFGTSQRPAQIDKDFLGNATLIRTGRLAYHEDVETMSKYMLVPEEQINALQPLDWIEKNKETGEVAKGRLTF